MKYVTHEVIEYLCDDCGTPLGNHIGWPYASSGNSNYCPNCALKNNVISIEEWLGMRGEKGVWDHVERDGDKITLYQKWGRGFRKYTVVLSNVGI